MINLSFKRRVMVEKFQNKTTRFDVEFFLQNLIEKCKIYSKKESDGETFFFVDDKEGLEMSNKFAVVLEIQCRREISVFVNEFGLRPLYNPYYSDWNMKNDIRYSIQSLFPNIISEKHIPSIKIDRTSDVSFVFAKANCLK